MELGGISQVEVQVFSQSEGVCFTLIGKMRMGRTLNKGYPSAQRARIFFEYLAFSLSEPNWQGYNVAPSSNRQQSRALGKRGPHLKPFLHRVIISFLIVKISCNLIVAFDIGRSLKCKTVPLMFHRSQMPAWAHCSATGPRLSCPNGFLFLARTNRR